MRRFIKVVLVAALFTALLSVTACSKKGANSESTQGTGGNAVAENGENSGDNIVVEKIDNLSDDFIKGVDVSSILSLEESGVKFYGFDGQEQDIFKTLAEAGVNYIRIRVWNNPFDENGNGYGGGNCDIDRAVEIGRRATENGMKVLINFHYSDFWADPKKQMVPKAWDGMDIDTKCEALYQYTADCMAKLKAAGVNVGMVQIGNEINNGMAGETSWDNKCLLLKAGAKAVREADPDILVALHFTNVENKGSYIKMAGILATAGVDYDVFGTSYYAYWHEDMENMSYVLSVLSTTYNKKVLVLENSYMYTLSDFDGTGNSCGAASDIVEGYPATVAGQARMVRDVMAAVASIGDAGIGYFYWEPAWIPAKAVIDENTDAATAWSINSPIWEQYGSGWASSYAAAYDPNDAGLYYGGSSWDNQAMFDATGHPLPSLNVFKYVNEGHMTEPVIDAIDDIEVTLKLGEPYSLPETVSAIYTDGSVRQVSITWSESSPDFSQTGTYLIKGSVNAEGSSFNGYEVNLTVSVKRDNLISDSSFEENDHSAWNLTYADGYPDCADFQKKSTDATTGAYALHFWDEKDMSFEASQDIEILVDGKYSFTANIQGGDAGENEMYIFVRIGDKEYRQDFAVDGWCIWQSPLIDNIELKAGDVVTCGISIKASGGAWGTIDDVEFMLK